MDHYFRRYRPWQRGEFVLVFQDTGAGGADNCAAQFLSQRWLDVPTVMQAHITATATTPLIHAELEDIYDQTGVRPVVAFERNNGGGFEMDRLARLNRLGNYRIYTMKALNPSGKLVDTGKLGFDTNTATRPKMLSDLDDGLNSRLLHLYDRPTTNELFSFIVNPKTGKAEAEQGAHDDLVMSLAGVWQLYQTEKPESNEDSGGVVETVPVGYTGGGIVYAG
jgi:hypothetical protein